MSHGFSRRSVLTMGLGLLAAASNGIPASPPGRERSALWGDLRTFPSPELESYQDELSVPPVARGDSTIEIGSSSHRFHRALKPAPTWSYGGAEYFGPTIEAHTDEPIQLTFRNALGRHLFAADVDPTLEGASEEARLRPHVSVHLHGAVTPPDMDGHPMDAFLPGSTRTYQHHNQQESANLWYHDHGMGITRLNVYAGLAGMYLLRDQFDTGDRTNAWDLPSGEFEIPLILADRRFHDDGSLNFRTVPFVPQGHWDGGQIGDRLTVNGTVSPYCHVARGFYRFRVLNASNLRSYNLSFSNRMSFWVIGNDGGLLDKPARTASVRISPGERTDLIVDFSFLRRGDQIEIVNDHHEAALIELATGAEVLRDVVRIIGTGSRSHSARPPERLRGGARQPPVLPVLGRPQRTRVVTLTQDLHLNRWPPTGMSLNNLCFSDNPIAMPRQGTTELWEIVNTTSEDHPVHLHLVNMRLVNRQAFDVMGYVLANPRPAMGTMWTPPPDPFLTGQPQAPRPWESGPKDTVTCPQNMVTRFLVHFPTPEELGFDPDAMFTAADGRQLQGYVWHCHILDHEDDCMMSRYRLTEINS
jgi:FtsP/CotA-like multicopper oxidase with cupredoxin domain